MTRRGPDLVAGAVGPTLYVTGPDARRLGRLLDARPTTRGCRLPAARLDDVAAYCQAHRLLLVIRRPR